MADVRVRRLGAGDVHVLAILAHEAAAFDLDGASPEDLPLSDEAARNYLLAPHVLHWIAESGDLVVGELLCHVLPLPFGAGREVLLYSIGVRDGWRRQGIGTLLMDELAAWQRRNDVPIVWVLADNPEARQFYAARGFGPDADEPDVTYLIRRG